MAADRGEARFGEFSTIEEAAQRYGSHETFGNLETPSEGQDGGCVDR
jgi:hypothetical protein